MGRRVVITGLAVSSPLGDSVEELWRALLAGRSGARPVGRFDTSALPCHDAAWIEGEPAAPAGDLFGKYLSAHTRRLCQTGRALLESAGLSAEGERAGLGMVLGSAFGSYGRAMGWHHKYNRLGYDGVLPSDGLDAEHNSAMSYGAIALGTRGLHRTVAAGAASGLTAVGQAFQAVRCGSAEALITGGHEGLCRELFALLALQGRLCRADPGDADGAERARPFDRARAGFTAGEGCALLLVEAEEHALARGARVLAELRGAATGFPGPDGDPEAAADTVAAALDAAGCAPREIDWVAAGASGSVRDDLAEALALERALAASGGRPAGPVPVAAIKGALGEAHGASGGLQCAAAICSIAEGRLPPTLHSRATILPAGLALVGPEGAAGRSDLVLVHGLDPHGFQAALVIGRHRPRQRTER